MGPRVAHLALVAVLGLLCCSNPPVPDEGDLLGDPADLAAPALDLLGADLAGPDLRGGLSDGPPGMGAEI